MKFHVLTVFPEMVEAAARFGVVGQALKDGRIGLTALSPRQFTTNVHQTIDDRPFGGGDGMIMMAEPMAQALESLKLEGSRRVVHLSPRGAPLTDRKARELAAYENLVLIASRYGGIDQRFLNTHVDEEISIGDYVLSGGELAALVVIDAVARLLPGVLGNARSAHEESFASGGLLEHPQFTRPRQWRGHEVPEALFSGHHAQLEALKRGLAILVTADRRPELLAMVAEKELALARKLWQELSEHDRAAFGLSAEAGERLSQGRG